MIHIHEVKEFTPLLCEELQCLLPLLGPMPPLSEEQLRRMISEPLCHLLVARREGAVVGMLTLALYDTLTARRGWVEDVVVKESERGRGVGGLLVRHARELAREAGCATLSLTSAAHRKAAHALYLREGFSPVETTLFRLKPESKLIIQ